MDLILFKSSSLPPPELPSATYLKMAEHGDQPTAKAGGEKQLRMEFPPQACNNQPQQKAKRKKKQQRAVSFQLSQGLAQPTSLQDDQYALPDLAWQQSALPQPHELQLTALHSPVVQQLASATTALIAPVIDPNLRRQPSEEQASHQQHESRSTNQKGTDAIAHKLQSILEKARSFQEIELAVNPSEEALQEAQEALQSAQLHASFDDDLSLFSAEEINKAKQKAGESLRGTYGQVSRASLTAQQLQQVIQTTWAFDERSSREGEVSLRARIVNTSFKQQIFELDCGSCASTPSHLSLKILLTLSLINKWDILTADISSALLRAPIANDELVLVQPPLELEQNQDVLWQLTRNVYGITSNLKQWQQCLASKLEELGLRKNKTDPCIFASAQLLVMIHHGAVLIGGEKHRQESFIDQLSASVSLSNITKLDAKTPLTFLNKTLEYSKQDHNINLHLPSSFYMKLFKRYGFRTATTTSTTGKRLSQKGPRSSKTLAPVRQERYRTAIGQLLWATSVRPDISFAVHELSRSLSAPTHTQEEQLKQLLSYLKGTLHFTFRLQPPRKKVIQKASNIQIQACFDSAWTCSTQTQKPTSGASLSLWGVPLTASCRTQVSQEASSVDAELSAMGMAVQDSLYLKSLLQDLHLSQMEKPFELTVSTDSSSGKVLASKLGITKKSKHVQLSYLFKHDLIVHGQLQLRKIQAGKNPATMLTKHLSASRLHKLLPTLGVTTRAADSGALFLC